MNQLFHLKTPQLAAALLLALPMAQAQVMTKADLAQGKARVEAQYKTDKTACGSMAGNAKDVCLEQAKAGERVGLAELEYSNSGKAGDRTLLMVAKAESAFAVAKEKCDDKAGNVKDVCVEEAKAIETKALADAKLGQQVDEAAKTAAQTTLDADYKVAIEKCDALAGDAKTGCTAAAKSKYGKT
jgi:hypothetical protein